MPDVGYPVLLQREGTVHFDFNDYLCASIFIPV